MRLTTYSYARPSAIEWSIHLSFHLLPSPLKTEDLNLATSSLSPHTRLHERPTPLAASHTISAARSLRRLSN